jgi:phosphatidylinositol-3-phosphatase
MSPDVIKYGDAFVGDAVTKIMASPTWNEGSAIIIVFDEDDYVQNDGCCGSPTGADGGYLGGALVPAVVVSSLNPHATKLTDAFNHYSMLATLQHIWGLGCLANTCGMTGNQLMTKLFLP